MTIKEKTILTSIIEDIRTSNDEIEGLVRLFREVKKLLKIK